MTLTHNVMQFALAHCLLHEMRQPHAIEAKGLHLAVLTVATKPSSCSTRWNFSTAFRRDGLYTEWPVSFSGSRLMLALVGSGRKSLASARAKSGVSFTPSIRTTSTNRCSRPSRCSTSPNASLYSHRMKSFHPTLRDSDLHTLCSALSERSPLCPTVSSAA